MEPIITKLILATGLQKLGEHSMSDDIGHRHLYQYPTMKDVAMDILRLVSRDDGKVDVIVEWWNVGPHRPFNMQLYQAFTMPISWIKELEEYTYQGELFTIPGVES